MALKAVKLGFASFYFLVKLKNKQICIKIKSFMNSKAKIKNCKVKTAKIWQTLILQNCLPLGKQARFTSKNVAQYLLGSRNEYDLFKFNDIKHLLLKFTPLIETLFRSKLVLQAKVGSVHKVRYGKPIPPKDPDRYKEWYERMKDVRIAKHNKTSYYKSVENKRPIKILFASINPMYAEIINEAAISCQMTAHTNRWLCGSITANSKPLEQKLELEKELTRFKGKTYFQRQFDKTFGENKEAKEQRYRWHNLNTMSRPALAIIPDINNNDMILREAVAKMIPVVGLVNSDEATRITYPIFGNSASAQVVHFFCSFLAVLLAKSFLQQKYKQASHRIFHRTRAFLNVNTKKTKHSSIKTYSKKFIRAQTQLFATSKKGFIKRRWFPKFNRRNSTIRKINQNLNTVSRYAKRKTILRLNKIKPLKKLIKAALKRKNYKLYKKLIKKVYAHKAQQRFKLARSRVKSVKLRQVGRKPYWKNIYMMIRTLHLRWFRKKPFRKLQSKQRILSKDIAIMFNTKKKVKSLDKIQKIDSFLLKNYTKQFNRIKKIDNKIIIRLKNSLKRYNTNASKKMLKQTEKTKKIQKTNAELAGRRYKLLTKKQKKTRWLRRRKVKRKLFVKAFGHQLLAKKQIRKSVQFKVTAAWHRRKATKYKVKSIFGRRKKWITVFKPKPKRRTLHLQLPSKSLSFLRLFYYIKSFKFALRNENVSNEQRMINTKILQTIQLIFADLSRQKAKMLAPLKYKKKNRINFLKKKFRNKRFLTIMLKKYPFTTLVTKQKLNFDEKRTALAKNTLQILLSEWNNYKKNPYTFSLKNYKRQKISVNNMFWKNIYFKTWILKSQKKAFKQRPQNRWVKSKTRFYGKIRRETNNRSYYFRKLMHAVRKTAFPKFLTKFKNANRTIIRKFDRKKFKTISFKLWHQRKFVLKFIRSHRLIPVLAQRIIPYRKNYKKHQKFNNKHLHWKANKNNNKGYWKNTKSENVNTNTLNKIETRNNNNNNSSQNINTNTINKVKNIKNNKSHWKNNNKAESAHSTVKNVNLNNKGNKTTKLNKNEKTD